MDGKREQAQAGLCFGVDRPKSFVLLRFKQGSSVRRRRANLAISMPHPLISDA
jgi:hypothetical protein